MTVEVTLGRGAKELKPGTFEIKHGMEILRTDPSDEVWTSWEVVGCTGVMTFHINPNPEEIQSNWERPRKA